MARSAVGNGEVGVAGNFQRAQRRDRCHRCGPRAAPDESLAAVARRADAAAAAGAGAAEGAIDAGNMLKPALARGELHCIGATTLDEYKKHVEKDAALARRFQPVYVNEPSVEYAIAILRGLKERYELFHGVHITDDAIVSAVQLSSRYITERFLPDKAIDLIDEAASGLRIALENKPPLLEETDRKIRRLEIERQALKKDAEAGDATKELTDRVKDIDNEIADLKEKIISGDKGDGIPNILSSSDCFVTETRQTSITKPKLQKFMSESVGEWEDEKAKTGFSRNKILIDLSCIPTDVSDRIINTYTETKPGNKQKLLNYFIKYKLKNLMDVIEDF